MTRAWHDKARALFRDGVTAPDIARRLGKQCSQVRYLVDEAYHERRRQQQVDTMAICAQFARGEIDRAELSRRLRGEA